MFIGSTGWSTVTKGSLFLIENILLRTKVNQVSYLSVLRLSSVIKVGNVELRDLSDSYLDFLRPTYETLAIVDFLFFLLFSASKLLLVSRLIKVVMRFTFAYFYKIKHRPWLLILFNYGIIYATDLS